MVDSYYTHDNRGRPFEVIIKDRDVSVLLTENNQLIKTYSAEKICIGNDDGEAEGNSFLLKLKEGCAFVGHEVYEFVMEDAIDHYYSKIGPNDVPYPVLLGTEHVYFMLDRVYVPRCEFPSCVDWDDAYTWFYGTWDNEKYVWINSMKALAKPMRRLKIIQKRLW
jgi:hypothetical protein